MGGELSPLPTVGTLKKIVCKTRILGQFQLVLWDIMSQKLLVSSQNMSIWGFFFSPLKKYWEDDNTGNHPASDLGGYIPHPPVIDTHGADL